MIHRGRGWTLVLALTAVGCFEGERGAGSRYPGAPLEVIVHPQRDRLLSSATGVRVVEIGPAPVGVSVPPGLEVLATFDSVRALGVDDGPAELTLGTIVAAAFVAEGATALVDRDYGTVRLFDAQMRPVGRVGAFGEGPGEFVRPMDLAEGARGSLLVLNGTMGPLRVERFRRSAGAYEFDRRVSLPVYPADAGSGLCAWGERVFVTGVRVEGVEGPGGGEGGGLVESPFLVHEVGEEGEILGSFSAPYPAPWERRREMDRRMGEEGVAQSLAMDVDVIRHFAAARLACDGEEGGRLWVGYSALGEVHHLTEAGELRWIGRLAGFESPALHQSIYPFSTSVGGDPNQTFPVSTDRITDVSLVTPEVLAVQVTRTRTERDRSRQTTFRTYLLHADRGDPLGGFVAGHRVMAGGGYRALLYREAVHPQVVSVRVGR